MSLPYLQSIRKGASLPSSRARGRDYGRANEFDPSPHFSPSPHGATHHVLLPATSCRSMGLQAFRQQHEFDPVAAVFHSPTPRMHVTGTGDGLIFAPAADSSLVAEPHTYNSLGVHARNASTGTAITCKLALCKSHTCPIRLSLLVQPPAFCG